MSMLKSNTNVMRIFLNPYCNYGNSASRWEKVKEELRNRIGEFETEEILSPDEIVFQLSRALKNGEDMFIAAGGDGTVHLLLNAIMKLSDNPHLTIGAVGLGSSNDFHKPFRPEAFINGVPVRIDFENAFPCDVIRIEYQDIQGHLKTRFCLLNASIGITAEGNAIFNSHLIFLRMLQKISTKAAITAAALKAVFSYHNIPCQLNVNNGEEQDFFVSNLGIIKNPHFTGSLCYDTPIEPDDGKLGINLCMDLSLFERIGMLVALHNHHFQGRAKTKSWMATRLSVKSEKLFALEMDGEIIHTKGAKFNIIPMRVRCCR